jgi:hypothetical protein
MNPFTTEDMLRYLYNEMTPEEALDMRHTLDSDWKLRACYEELKQLLANLDAEVRSPRPQSIAAILQYADSETVKAEIR